MIAAANATTGTTEMNRTISGETINNLMILKTTDNSAYYNLLKVYNKARSMWDASLRIASSSGLFDFTGLNFLRPDDELSEVYVQPPRPDMPYRPAAYTGPSFKNTSPIYGYGKPSSMMYDLVTGVSGSDLVYKWKAFGVLGTSSNTTAHNLGVRENPPASGTCRPAYMAITILPKAGYTQVSGQTLHLTVGMYDWRTLNMTTPEQPPAPIPPAARDWNTVAI